MILLGVKLSDSDLFQVMSSFQFNYNNDNNGHSCSVFQKNTEALQRGRLEIKVLV